MTTKTFHSAEELQVMVAQALQTYELAQAVRLQVERQGQGRQQQATLVQVETDSKREDMETTVKQEGVEQLLAAIEQVEKVSRDLLIQLDKSSSRSGGEVVTTGFFTVQLAYIDMRTSLLRLATLLMETTRWEEARRVVQPLLEDEKAPFYTDARNLLYDSYYQSVESALSEGDLVRAASDLQQLVKVNFSYKRTPQLLEEVVTQLSDKAMWNFAVRIIVAVEDISVVNNSVLQRLDNTKELQAAMAAIKNIEFLWSTTIMLPHGTYISASMEPVISHLTFSNNSQLIAFDYRTSYYSSGYYYYSGVMVLDTQTGSVIATVKHQEGERSEEPIISLIFDSQNQYLQVHIQGSNQITLDLATGTAQRNQTSDAHGVSRPSQQVSSLVLEQIREKAKETLTEWVTSYNRLYVATVDVKKNLYMFRKSASFE